MSEAERRRQLRKRRELIKEQLLMLLIITSLVSIIVIACSIFSKSNNKQITTTKSNKSHNVNINLSSTYSDKKKYTTNLSTKKSDNVNTTQMSFDSGDEYLLAKIAMAEAEGESTEIKALVMLTVLNRIESDEFPSTIHDVIYQERNGVYQFTPVGNGRWNKVEPNEDCYKALEMVYTGYDESEGSLYFEACVSSDNWHSRNLKFLFEIDSVRFYK